MNVHQDEFDIFKKNNPHVISFRNKRMMMAAVKFVAIETAVAVAALTMKDHREAMIIFWTLGGLLLPLLLKPWKYINKKWVGTIDRIDLVQRRIDVEKNHSSNPVFYNTMRDIIFMKARVTVDQRHTIFFELEKRYQKVYKVGDRLMHIPGIDFPINLTPSDDNVCPRCGGIMPLSNDYCVGCGMKKTNL